MDKTEQLIARTEELLRQIEGLQGAIQQLNGALRTHHDELDLQLVRLRNKKAPLHEPLRPLTVHERRAAPRRKGNPISVHIANGTATTDAFQGWVVDRSASGLRVLVDESIAPGTVLSIRPVKVHDGFPWVQIKVKNCYPERKSWNLGCQFIHKLSWADLQHFG